VVRTIRRDSVSQKSSESVMLSEEVQGKRLRCRTVVKKKGYGRV
jgi:hypothetical protein